jgi:predicted RNase H-like HicB family nuclease
MQKRISSYTAIFEPVEEGGYVSHVPMLPGCMTQGKTFEESLHNIQEAIRGYVAVLQEDGDEVPVESGHAIMTTVHLPM